MYKEKTLINMILAFLLSIYMPTNSFASENNETKSELNSEDIGNDEKSEDSDETADEEDSSDDEDGYNEDNGEDSGGDEDNAKDSGSDEKGTTPDDQQSEESKES